MARKKKVPRITSRVECGHTYRWHEGLGFWYSISDPAGVAEYPVLVFPPAGTRTDWWVVVPGARNFHSFKGEDVEKRAFAIAAGYITPRKS